MPHPIEIPANGRGSELPDFFQDLSFPLSHTLIDNQTNSILLFYAERTLVVDSVIVGVADGDSGITVQLLAVTTPGNTTGTAIHATPVSITTAGTYKPTIDSTNNVVPTGSWLLAKYVGSVNTLHMSLHIRYRTRQA